MKDKDIEWLYQAAEKIGKRPTEADEERFCELVAKRTADDMPEMQARREALKEMYA